MLTQIYRETTALTHQTEYNDGIHHMIVFATLVNEAIISGSWYMVPGSKLVLGQMVTRGNCLKSEHNARITDLKSMMRDFKKSKDFLPKLSSEEILGKKDFEIFSHSYNYDISTKVGGEVYVISGFNHWDRRVTSNGERVK